MGNEANGSLASKSGLDRDNFFFLGHQTDKRISRLGCSTCAQIAGLRALL